MSLLSLSHISNVGFIHEQITIDMTVQERKLKLLHRNQDFSLVFIGHTQLWLVILYLNVKEPELNWWDVKSILNLLSIFSSYWLMLFVILRRKIISRFSGSSRSNKYNNQECSYTRHMIGPFMWLFACILFSLVFTFQVPLWLILRASLQIPKF